MDEEQVKLNSKTWKERREEKEKKEKENPRE